MQKDIWSQKREFNNKLKLINYKNLAEKLLT